MAHDAECAKDTPADTLQVAPLHAQLVRVLVERPESAFCARAKSRVRGGGVIKVSATGEETHKWSERG